MFLNPYFTHLLSFLVCLSAQVSSKIPTFDWLKSRPLHMVFKSPLSDVFFLPLSLTTYLQRNFLFHSGWTSILPLTCPMYFCLFVYIIFLPGVSGLFSFSLCKVHSLGVCHMLLFIVFLIFHGYALSSPLDCKPLKGRGSAFFGTLFSNSTLHVVGFQ